MQTSKPLMYSLNQANSLYPFDVEKAHAAGVIQVDQMAPTKSAFKGKNPAGDSFNPYSMNSHFPKKMVPGQYISFPVESSGNNTNIFETKSDSPNIFSSTNCYNYSYQQSDNLHNDFNNKNSNYYPSYANHFGFNQEIDKNPF
jgi:hypothetical protein